MANLWSDDAVADGDDEVGEPSGQKASDTPSASFIEQSRHCHRDSNSPVQTVHCSTLRPLHLCPLWIVYSPYGAALPLGTVMRPVETVAVSGRSSGTAHTTPLRAGNGRFRALAGDVGHMTM